MTLFSTLVAALACGGRVLATFGVSNSTSSYTIDSGSADGFVFAVSRTDCSVTSIKYRGTEYQYSSQTSHIASGLGSATVSYSIISGKSPTLCCRATSPPPFPLLRDPTRYVYQSDVRRQQYKLLSHTLLRGEIWRDRHLHGHRHKIRTRNRGTPIHRPPEQRPPASGVPLWHLLYYDRRQCH